jgi:exopolysaccharide biosynthesis polyprenyl glycosylphosphotransferase
VAAVLNDMYRPALAGRTRDVLRRLLRAQTVLIFVYLIIYFVSTPRSLPRLFLLYYAAIATPLLFVSRAAFSVLFVQPRFRMRTLIVGAGWAGRTAVEVIQDHLQDEYVLVGLVDDDADKQGDSIGDVRVMGDGAALPDLVRINDIDLLVVAITRGISPALFQNILACQQAGVGVISMSSLYERTLERTPVHHLPEQWFMEFEPPDVLTQIVKRIIDLAFAIVAGIGLAVLLPFLALAIRLESPGGVFYRQERLGRNGKPFWVYKLRSMVPDAEKGGAQWAQENDPRITRVGRFLRKTRLDELPQVWNVLRGEMSLIGPRPERPEFVAQLQEQIPYYRSRLSVRPGLTGWAQVRYRYGNSVEDARMKLEYDLYYIKHQSLLLDLSILFRTVGVVLKMAGT